MDMFDGFVFLEEKKKSLIPILCQYDFLSALTAAFSITSWRKNRGAQESCLALNSAMVENTEWGRKTIFTPNDLEEFFQLLYPILKTTPYDDPVLPDFGEIKLNYRSKYYSVITGTGHTAPIFSALQFLEKISESACMDAYTDSLLCYSDYCIDFLKAKNTPINEDFSLHPQFESPTFDYYENVKDFMTEEKWTGLGTPLLSMLAAESNEIVRSHFFEKVANAFYEDLGVHFKVLESVLHHLSDSSFSHDNVEFDEIAPNVIKAKATDVLNDYLSFVVENVPVEDVKSAYDFLTIVPGQLKTICDTTHPILPIWEREKRNHCFAVRPIYMSNNDYIYSPIIMEEVRKRWIEGFLQFYPPFEIGLERTCTALYAWKNNYEHLFSSEVEVLLKESGCEYAKHDVDLRREDRRGNHPTIDVLGDYDVIGLNTTQKRIFIIECKVLQPIGSVFEHSNQQKRFFTKEKFDEKFQKRIDYFSKVAMSFFANHGYDTEGFTINPYMVVNKVFSSYYKHVQFPIVTFDELKREIQL